MVDKPILQYGSLAGWPFLLAEALTRLGYPSENVIPEERDVHDLNRRLPHHAAISRTSSSRSVRMLQRASFLARVPQQYSLVHYHGSHLLRGSMHHVLEGRYLAARSVPMIVSFGGGDARIVEIARARNPYFYRPADPARDESIRRYLRSVARYVPYVATDCEMAEYVTPFFKDVFTFRQPVDLDRLQPIPLNLDRRPVFLHVPTEPLVKGTEQIVAAFKQLRSEGLEFEFRLIRQLTQAEFFRELSACDVYVDELRCGSHGVTAVEAMAAGKATVTYIRPDLIARYPSDLPLVNANPDTVLDVLRRLIMEPQWRAETAAASRAYAEKYHDARIVARDMLDVYRRVGFEG
ncbi:glycosyltransferase [Ramlibacter sp. RBP-2]|uniref:Glycosyltransferase n=1 Tax=Ramlibacter lithotrophicus TaxID=2606681 RepID=A0A7X6DKE8_9BURK|nr:glycosyltransferase [Ramlibacter lithotrophicus]NKE68719.1 glycosyltransferase [Ramlibacter lithotrophicus]